MLDVRLKKEFRKGTVLFGLDVEFSFSDAHKNVVLFGPSGSGKTLTMHCIAGLTRPDAGYVSVRGRVLYDYESGICVPARKRKAGYMFQDYALFPHLTVLQNVAFPRGGILARVIRKTERERAMDVLERFGIGHLAGHYPHELSGGQRQRAALARSCNADPQIMLLDEPFSALDPLLRDRLRGELSDMLTALDIPVLIVTHDPEDVDAFAGGLVLYGEGKARQIGNYAAIRSGFRTGADCLRHLQESRREPGSPPH